MEEKEAESVAEAALLCGGWKANFKIQYENKRENKRQKIWRDYRGRQALIFSAATVVVAKDARNLDG